jgi:pyridoxamine 5'-phosphate oxidase
LNFEFVWNLEFGISTAYCLLPTFPYFCHMQNNDLSKIRNEYLRGELDISHVLPDPYHQFGIWMDQAIKAEIEEPTAMTLATVTGEGKPSARMVLLKGFDEKGFVFFTNYDSRKGQEIAKNHRVVLVFYWKELERQVRIEGFVLKTSGQESDDYFRSRPAESQVSAIISPQSNVIPDRKYLENLRDEYLKNYPGERQRPKNWGGYQVVAEVIEFWQGRENRLHDRLRYTRKGGEWIIERLAP